AVNLAGVAKDDLRRGDLLTLPAALHPTYALDVRLEVTVGAPRPIEHNAEVEVYAGAAEVPARVALLEADMLRPGESGWAQLRLRRPLVAMRGDRFIVRIPSPSLTVGGGVVVESMARRHRRRDLTVLARLAVLAHGDPEEVVLAALRPDAEAKGLRMKSYGGRDLGVLARLAVLAHGDRGEVVLAALRPDAEAKGLRMKSYGGREPAVLEQSLGLPAEEIGLALQTLLARGMVVPIGTHVYAATEWARLRDDALRILADYHQQYPLRPGMPREEWRGRPGPAPPAGRAPRAGPAP